MQNFVYKYKNYSYYRLSVPTSFQPIPNSMLHIESASLTDVVVNMSIRFPFTPKLYCVDVYRVTAVIGGRNVIREQNLTNLTHTIYRFEFPVDICNSVQLTSAIAVAVTDEVEGNMATLSMPDTAVTETDLSSKLNAVCT